MSEPLGLMRGSVIRRDSVYYVKIEFDPDPGTGKRRTKWHSGYRTRREAERARVGLLSKFDRGVYVEPTQETLAEFLEEWLATIRSTVKATTWNGYRSKIRNHVIPYIGGMRLMRVDGGVLNALYTQLLEGGRRKPSRTGKGYSPAVVARAQELRAEGLSLQATADRLQVEVNEASHITKDTLRPCSGDRLPTGPTRPRSTTRSPSIRARSRSSTSCSTSPSVRR